MRWQCIVRGVSRAGSLLLEGWWAQSSTRECEYDMQLSVHERIYFTVPENRTTDSTSEMGSAANACLGQFRISCVSMPSVIWSLYSKSISALYQNQHVEHPIHSAYTILRTMDPTSSDLLILALLNIGNSSPKLSSVTWIGPKKFGLTPPFKIPSTAKIKRSLILASSLYCKIACASKTLSQSVLSGGWCIIS